MTHKVIMKRETLTPPSSVESTSAVNMENGYHGQSSDESTSDANFDEAPLDFSVRKRNDSLDDLGSDGAGDPAYRSSESAGSQSAGESSITSAGTDTPPQHITNGISGGTVSVKNEPLSPMRNLTEIKPEDLLGKIGEPRVTLPGAVPGAVFPGMPTLPGILQPGLNAAAAAAAAAAAGMLPNPGAIMGGLPFPTSVPDPRKQNSSSKPTRPFKAYPKDPLSLPLGYYGIPGMLAGMPLPNIDASTAQTVNANTEELFNQYRLLLQGNNVNGKLASPKGSKQSEMNQTSHETKYHNDNDGDSAAQILSTSPASGGSLSPQNFKSASAVSPISPTNTSTTGTPSPPMPVLPSMPIAELGLTSSPGAKVPPRKVPFGTPPRKKARTLPEDKKDDAYWDRRRKNNEAAKRSRDARRAKEDEIAIRAAFLEQENLKLRVEVAALKNETAKLRCMLYNS